MASNGVAVPSGPVVSSNLMVDRINEDDAVVAPETVLATHASQYRLPRFSSRRRSTNQSRIQRTPSMFPEPKQLTAEDLSSADALMADGVFKLNSTLSTVVQDAIGRPIPGMEVRFQNIQLSAEVPQAKPGSLEVPTLWTQTKQMVMNCGPGKAPMVNKPILQGVSGVFKPGRITLVLGQPGSGKSSLMKVLSGRFHMAKNISLSGDVHYNNTSRADMLDCLPRFVAYVNQIDEHYPRMTVLETFEFAHRCCGGDGLEPWAIEALKNCSPDQHDYALKVANAFHQYLPEITVKKLGLDNCKDTIVGNAELRGVSGGERKRVTTGEMMFGRKSVQLLDEISTGLDSAATFDIVKSMKSAARNFNTTVVISLLQPSPEVFELFDDLLLMNEGSLMYHGKRTDAVAYFETLGFHCPPRKDVADFLLDLGTDKQSVYVSADAALTTSVPSHASEFAAYFRDSDIFQHTLRYLDTPLKEESALEMDRRPFRQTFMQDLATLFQRQWLLTMRNTAYLGGRAVMNIVMGLLYGSTFWQMDDSNSQLILGLLFSCATFLSMSQASQVPTFIEERSVFYKQRGANFFRTGPYVLASSITQIPIGILETIIFGAIVYWMGGYVDLADRFLLYLLTLFLCQIWFTSYFFFISSVSPNLTIAQPTMMVSVLFFVLFSGFLLTKDNIPDYLIWIFWINPLSWCIRGLSINQYRASKFDVCEYNGVDYCSKYGMTVGKYSLNTFDLESDKAWIYYGWIYFIAGYFCFVFFSYIALEYNRYEAPEDVAVIVDDEDEDKMVYSIMPETPKYQDEPNDDNVIVIQEDGDVSSSVAMSTIPVDETGRGVVPVTLAFHDLWYSVPLPGGRKDEEIDLLKGVSGFALPGTMTALMGSSGAGKTTLMDVIAGRKTGGRIQGKILLNGYPATDLAVRRCTGYCEQMDIHSESATVREALIFSAFLRQDARISDAEKFASVDECIRLLELGPIADKIIRGSSTEQMKRITIGVELAAQPSVLFMDEPTSGLDARSAKLIMNGVRKIANTGRTVVCTIHQPSTEVFNFFDSLLLLRRGGRMVYFGELGRDSRKLISYFQDIPGVHPIKPGYNPATWMLECIGAGVGNEQHADFAEIFLTSDKKALMDEDLDQDGVLRPSPDLPEVRFGRKRASRSVVQLNLLCERFFKMYWRTPTYNLTRLMISVVLAAIYAIIYQGTDYTTYAGANAGVGLVFVSTLFFGIIGFNSVMPVASEERTAFYRERASETYNALWYFVAGTVAEIPYVFLSSLLFTAILFPSVGFTGFETFIYYWIVVSLNALVFVYLGQLMVYALPSVEVASTVGALLSSIFMLFAGFNPPTDNIPDGYIWVHYISPPSYTISILVSLVFADCDSDGGDSDSCQLLSNTPPAVGDVTLKQYVEGTFSMKHDDIWRNVGITIALIVAFRALALFALRYINHLKR